VAELHKLPCRTVDPETFFPVGTTGPAILQAEEAKALCARCPIIGDCLIYALDMGIEFGVWGGMDEHERRSIRRKGTINIRRTVETRNGLVRELASA
jgi:WhiB family redox-sensing transcriptional regulator